MYIEDMWPTCIINPSYKILYNFLNDPRNINSKEVAIHNKLRQERINRRYFCLARGNGKVLTTQRLMEEMFNGGFVYTARRSNIPKQEFDIGAIKRTMEDLKQAHELEEQRKEPYRLLTESCEEYVKRKTEEELNKVWITSSNPYWEPIARHDEFIFSTKIFDTPMWCKRGVVSDVFRESDST